ncbi:hypothetical protein Poli38472_004192 [Pythium oligandrum]|uniref:Phosphatidate phosphatase APP1 catalytic domain-containing protein n=1 Tax=Pythium oligandrum TaxID=41045 RepID=A0A8K1CMS6_PYTOL|nr:hypothetical protein Poli38472_004192 [Pythium oligandrum]|eukprot:TMW66427.1 hypothetical protein Poli38472_004192 [Pythium oligandrum]
MRIQQQPRHVSTWQLAAGGLQRKWKGIKQRTAWRFKTLKDRNTAIVFCTDEQKEKEIHFKPRSSRNLDDPMACHSVLASVSTDSLNGILGATSPQNSSHFSKTMTGFMLHSCSPPMRARVLDVIAFKRLDEITIVNRAVIIRAIQRCLLSPLHTEKAVLHAAACNILRSTYGKDLTLLKEQIHAGDEVYDEPGSSSSFYGSTSELLGGIGVVPPTPTSLSNDADAPHSGDLSQLLFGNKNVTEVVQVMQHIAIESLKVKQESPDLVKVISDIDDTLYPGWMDRRYPLHVPYPGVLELYDRVSRGIVDDPKIEPPVTFLTARPRGWLSVGRYLTIQHLRSLGVPNVTVLNGSVKGLVSSKKIAEVKLENFTRFAALFPEFNFVFFGDSGQGDALLASRLLESFPMQVLGTFIHDVNPTVDKTGDGQHKEVYKRQGVDFFSTYPGAGLFALDKGLISPDDLQAVTQAAEEELSAMQFHGANAEAKKTERRHELELDTERVQKMLESL